MDKKSNSAKKLLSVAALFSLPLLPTNLHAQVAKEPLPKAVTKTSTTDNIFIKISNKNTSSQKLSCVGVLKGQPVFKNGNNEYLIVDPKTGDIKTLSPKEYAMMDPAYKMQHNLNNIKIMGVDDKGNVIQETDKGEKFFLDPKTGDMVPYIQPGTIKK